MFISLLPLSVVVRSVRVCHDSHPVDLVFSPLTLVLSIINEKLIASSVPVGVFPFTDVVCSVRLDLTTISVHFVVSPLSFIQEAEPIELSTLTVPSTLHVSFAFILYLIPESYSWSQFNWCFVFNWLRIINQFSKLLSGFDALTIILHAFLSTGKVPFN